MTDHVLITGGAGFIGTRLARRFVDAGHTVTVLDALIPQVHGDDPATTSPLLRSLEGVATVVHGSVTSVEKLREALTGANIVVHLAAETGTGQSMYEIDRYVETNVGGTAKLLDLLANEPTSVRRVVIASSRSMDLSSWFTRWRDAPSSCASSSCASCRPMRISSPCARLGMP